jgi:hypothetical protein
MLLSVKARFDRASPLQHETSPEKPLLGSQSILPAHSGCPHSQEISAPVLTVSQWGLQYLLSLAAEQPQPGCLQRFLLLSSINNPFLTSFGLPSHLDLIQYLLDIRNPRRELLSVLPLLGVLNSSSEGQDAVLRLKIDMLFL